MRTIIGVATVLFSSWTMAQNYEGQLVIPDGPTLPIGVEFITMADGSRGANVVSMAQGQRYMASRLVTYSDQEFEIEIPGIGGSISATAEDDGYRAALAQGGAQFEFILDPVSRINEPVRPQTPDQAAQSEEVAVENRDDSVWLSGTLTLAEREPLGAVVLVGGSGPTHRDEYHSGHRPFAVIANVLTEAGFHVVRFDKRGVHKSTGTFVATDIDATARDAMAVTQLMKQRFPKLPIGMVGHSEGSLVAAMVARQTDVHFIVSLAGPAMPVTELFSLQDRTEAIAAGATPEQARALEALTTRLYEVARKVREPEARMSQWQEILGSADETQAAAFEAFNGGTGTLSGQWASQATYSDLLRIKPMEIHSELEVPSLWLVGGLDVQVPPIENLQAIIESAQQPARITYLPNVNHMLQPASTGSPSGYAEIEVSVAEEVLDAITAFVSEQAARAR